jgi:hypothetical protein
MFLPIKHYDRREVRLRDTESISGIELTARYSTL